MPGFVEFIREREYLAGCFPAITAIMPNDQPMCLRDISRFSSVVSSDRLMKLVSAFVFTNCAPEYSFADMANLLAQ